VLPLYPGYLAYLSGGQVALANRQYGRYFLGFFVLAGVLAMMLTLGLVIALLSLSVGSALAVVIPLADAMIISLGIMLLLNYNPFKQLPQLQVPGLSNPYLNAFTYGLLYGPIALPCSGPLVVGIFAYSLTAGEALSQLAIFLWFGVGFGLPLLALSFLSGAAQRWITRQFAIHARWVNAIGGLLLVGIGLYDLWANWDVITLFLASG
jgi:cytochrome c-type biogenesis protein